MQRSFLFLQGPDSPFFAKLGRRLSDNGHRVLRLNFTDKDKFFWDGESTADYKFPLSEFAAYLKNVARLRKITDLILYTDSTPINKEAIKALKSQKIRIYVFDKGYFGRSWITLEDRIFGDKTILPKDPGFYLRNIESDLPDIKKFSKNSRAASIFALRYKLSRVLGNKTLFPSDREQTSTGDKQRTAKRSTLNRLQLQRQKYFLVDSDLSRKSSLIRSFASEAQARDQLAFFSERAISQFQVSKIKELAAKHAIEDRVKIIEKADFKSLARKSKAYVTNHSLQALRALKWSVPVLALSPAIYNIKGLTSQAQLTDFWQAPQKPDMEVFRKFRNYAIAKTQLNGCFYNKSGMELAVKAALAKISSRDQNLAEGEASDISR